MYGTREEVAWRGMRPAGLATATGQGFEGEEEEVRAGSEAAEPRRVRSALPAAKL